MENVKSINTEDIRIITINDVDLEYDVFDLDFASKYEKGLELVQKEASKQQGKKMADVIRTQCNSVFNFFDDLFGAGTSESIFGERVNLKECIIAFKTFTETINEQTEEIKPILDEIQEKKNQSLNRAQRRSKK